MRILLFLTYILTHSVHAGGVEGWYSCFDPNDYLKARFLVGPAEKRANHQTSYVDAKIFKDVLPKDVAPSFLLKKQSKPRSRWWGKSNSSGFFTVLVQNSRTKPSFSLYVSKRHGKHSEIRKAKIYSCLKESEPYMTRRVFKILTAAEWTQLKENGEFAGSEHDRRDGFIHLSTKEQVDIVIKKYFSKIRPLYIAEFADEEFVKGLKWEEAKSGGIYPHLYDGKLLLNQMADYRVLK